MPRIKAYNEDVVLENTDIEKQSNFFLGILQGLSVASKTMNKTQLNDYISVALKQIK